MCELDNGFTAGAEAHRRRGEKVCDVCRLSRNAYVKNRKRAQAAGTWVPMSRASCAPAVLLDHIETFGAETTKVLELQLEDRFTHNTIRRSLYRLVDRGQLVRKENWEGRTVWAMA